MVVAEYNLSMLARRTIFSLETQICNYKPAILILAKTDTYAGTHKRTEHGPVVQLAEVCGPIDGYDGYVAYPGCYREVNPYYPPATGCPSRNASAYPIPPALIS